MDYPSLPIRMLMLLPLILLNVSSLILNALNAKDLDNQKTQIDDAKSQRFKDIDHQLNLNIVFCVLSFVFGIMIPIFMSTLRK